MTFLAIGDVILGSSPEYYFSLKEIEANQLLRIIIELEE
jgi:hypothetical protein